MPPRASQKRPSRRASHGAPAPAESRSVQTPPGRAYPAIPRTPAKRNAFPRVAEAPSRHVGHTLPHQRSPAQYKRRSAELIPRTPAKRNAFPYIAEAPSRRAGHGAPAPVKPAPHKSCPTELIPPSRERPPNAMPPRISQKRHLAAPGMAFPRKRSPTPHKSRPAELIPPSRERLPNAMPSRTSQKRLHHHAGHGAPAPAKPTPHGYARLTAPDAVAPTGAVPASPPLYTQMLACASILFAHASILSYFHKIRLFSGK